MLIRQSPLRTIKVTTTVLEGFLGRTMLYLALPAYGINESLKRSLSDSNDHRVHFKKRPFTPQIVTPGQTGTFACVVRAGKIFSRNR